MEDRSFGAQGEAVREERVCALHEGSSADPIPVGRPREYVPLEGSNEMTPKTLGGETAGEVLMKHFAGF